MAFTQQQLDELEAAISSGTTQISANGRMQTFRSLEDMMKLRDLMAQQLGATDSGLSRRRKYFVFQRD
jgi:hypothetical protein